MTVGGMILWRKEQRNNNGWKSEFEQDFNLIIWQSKKFEATFFHLFKKFRGLEAPHWKNTTTTHRLLSFLSLFTLHEFSGDQRTWREGFQLNGAILLDSGKDDN